MPPNSSGGGIYLANSVTLSNSILWDNTSYGSLSQIYGTATLYNCCLHNSQINLTRINCISDNPLFVNASSSIYKLQSTSPCINAGGNSYVVSTTDYYGNPRIFGSFIDIGSHEYIVTYIITFKDWDGTQLGQQTVNQGSSAIAPTNPTRIGYSFTGWDTNFSNVTTNLTVTALYSINSYTVTFKDWDGTQLKQQTVNYGGSAISPANPTRIGYSFTGWDTNFSNVTTNLTVTASYSINSYIVTFKDWDGTQLNQQTVDYGNSATAPSNPTRTGYSFTGWDTNFSNVSSSITVTALYSINSYTVTFKDWDGTQLNQQTVNYGSSAIAPSNPTRTGYSFTGWDINFSNVSSDLSVTAEYSPVTNISKSSDQTYSCYPNPVANKLYVEIPNNNELLTIIITNDLGKIIHKQSTLGDTCLEFKFDNLPQGLYFINISDDNGKIFAKKIIKL